jgi:hypothetical protein
MRIPVKRVKMEKQQEVHLGVCLGSHTITVSALATVGD